MIFKLNIEETLSQLMAQEDTDKDKKITVEDQGPKRFVIKSTSDREYEVEGTYHLSNLLQELVLAKNEGNEIAEIPISKIEEAPAKRISRMIRDYYWKGLTRRMDEKGILSLISDTKNETLTAEKLPIYVPHSDNLAFKFYQGLSKEHPIEVVKLPEKITPEYVKSINNKPGILSLKLTNGDSVTASPFVVPGGRFNEMYGWDSYFESIGLILDGKVDLAKAMADNFQYEIQNYGQILNANRSYYLTRTQPPFYSSLIREVFEKTGDKEWLKNHLETAIWEYQNVWMKKGKRLNDTGLNRYLAQGIGIPPETEKGHFDSAIKPYADKEGLSIEKYIKLYNQGQITNPDLDEYFVHDRSMRESGHDTSNRLDGKCAYIVPVELNALLYKYEIDFAKLIEEHFEDIFYIKPERFTSNYWYNRAENRKKLVDKYLWNEEKHLYLDYNINQNKQEDFVSATALTPLWSGLASKAQALNLVEKAIPLLKERGGIASTTKQSRGEVSHEHPQRQWDYPFGWAPHQMMIWKGLYYYGFNKEAEELIYRWLYMITKNAVDYNGTIPEKYDVVAATHKVFAEYGNVGTDFNYITQEGFGWMNASYQYGLSLLDKELIHKLDNLQDPDLLF
ncbi:MAG: trehalase family glycosidase [Flavobacteriaceae bacterium]|nr:trehalase family glycosidase [Flavobacteriaceae bacterium]